MAYGLLCRSPQYELRNLGTHVRHMQHEGKAGKWKRAKLFKEHWPMLRKRTSLKNHKSTMDNGHIDEQNTSVQITENSIWRDLNLLLTNCTLSDPLRPEQRPLTASLHNMADLDEISCVQSYF